MQVRTMRGLTQEEYIAMQGAVKKLGFPVTLRMHRERYCAGAIDIRPTKKLGHRFTTDQVEAIRNLAATLNLDDGMHGISQRQQWDPCCFWQGVNYLHKIG